MIRPNRNTPLWVQQLLRWLSPSEDAWRAGRDYLLQSRRELIEAREREAAREAKPETSGVGCDHCGACCKSLIVEIRHIDLVREPRLAPPATKLMDGAGLPEDSWDRQYLLACGVQWPCPMHQAERCAIYPTRPNTCVAFEAGSPECQRARYYQKLAPLGREDWPSSEDELCELIGEDYSDT